MSKLCVDKLCVSKLCAGGGGRRRRRQAGVHNQKQEPHTKMWGKNSSAIPNSMIVSALFPIPHTGSFRNLWMLHRNLAEHNLDGAPNLQEPDVDIAPELSGSFSGTFLLEN